MTLIPLSSLGAGATPSEPGAWELADPSDREFARRAYFSAYNRHASPHLCPPPWPGAEPPCPSCLPYWQRMVDFGKWVPGSGWTDRASHRAKPAPLDPAYERRARGVTKAPALEAKLAAEMSALRAKFGL